MKVLITGGAGYIGNELTESLMNQTGIDEVIIYDNLSRGNRNLFIGFKKLDQVKVSFIKGELLDSRSLKKALQKVEVVYHLAANVSTPFADQNPHLFEQVNNWGTAELVNAIEESDVKRLIYLSSVSVYGTTKEAVSATAHLNPRTFYGISKMRGEEHLIRLNKRVKTYIIRCANVYGYNRSMRFDAVINRFMFEANFNGRITVNGDGSQKRPFVHIQKVAEVLKALLDAKLESGAYNLVQHNYAVGEIVEVIRKIYPELEMLFVNQHMKMRQLLVEPSVELMKLGNEGEHKLINELKEFKKAFTF